FSGGESRCPPDRWRDFIEPGKVPDHEPLRPRAAATAHSPFHPLPGGSRKPTTAELLRRFLEFFEPGELSGPDRRPRLRSIRGRAEAARAGLARHAGRVPRAARRRTGPLRGGIRGEPALLRRAAQGGGGFARARPGASVRLARG